jgi:uncharacterized Fe-S radical SAM superfamily protein PflX
MMADTFRIARVGLHHFEEPCISGEKGSGTIFFSGCNMKCVFCQNHQVVSTLVLLAVLVVQTSVASYVHFATENGLEQLFLQFW